MGDLSFSATCSPIRAFGDRLSRCRFVLGAGDGVRRSGDDLAEALMLELQLVQSAESLEGQLVGVTGKFLGEPRDHDVERVALLRRGFGPVGSPGVAGSSPVSHPILDGAPCARYTPPPSGRVAQVAEQWTLNPT